MQANEQFLEFRKRHNLRQKDISEITGYSASHITKWALGREHKDFREVPEQALRLMNYWEEEQKELFKNSGSKVWGLINHKGGVGKTTITFHFGKMLADKGYKVLLVDHDPQRHLTSSFVQDFDDIESTVADIYQGKPWKTLNVKNNLDIIPGYEKLHKVQEIEDATEIIFLLKEAIDSVKDNYDYVLIDSLPSDGPLYKACLVAANLILVPYTPDNYDTWGLHDITKQIDKLKMRGINTNLKIGALIGNNIARPTRSFDKTILQSVAEQFKDQFLTLELSQSVKVKECKNPYICESITEYAPSSQAAKDYDKALKHILKSIMVKA
ncbi:ParA family protein (plasmid) [Piscirickettsia salmonis]|uniref:ParA n=1 Tax=Piscirickettsia salmonis TaxID=1238 RepID=A0A1L6TIJ5_PISSA|nr:AAA family ATPase [Piscirickettsia salmonis]AKP74995.1 hypothetical protein PSLF89_2p2 [Piscirickettsia salmonis LF-89 = ATCC VR-1361]ALB24708.1 ParA [Piscirickettsia salmonis]ALY04600.1 hypothetical protein AWE47_16985 [Piscirickettsia salmonis]AMA44030.1 hypothetical protein AWJ11_16795 [Piscirickettsia salmonis]AOS36895.1 hypothetical protein AVM72_16090 [Piscirickettsia salmonis]